MPFTIVRQDITKMQVDAIVNAANGHLLMGGGVCGAIFEAAGARKMQEACDKLSPIDTGEAVITPGFALRANYVVHAVGPVYRANEAELCEMQLRAAYRNSLRVAMENKCESIAFPLISSGIYGYPKDEALKVATDEIRVFLDNYDMDIYLAIFDKRAFDVSEQLLGEVKSYIDENYVESNIAKRRSLLDVEKRALSEPMEFCMSMNITAEAPQSIDDIIGDLDEPFNESLLRIIDAKGKTDVEVYKRANIDRKLFSKIRTGKGYVPSKRTILALAVALELSLEETDELLEKAGYALSHSQKFDVIVEFFIVSGQYDIYEINQILFKYDQPLLGAN